MIHNTVQKIRETLNSEELYELVLAMNDGYRLEYGLLNLTPPDDPLLVIVQEVAPEILNQPPTIEQLQEWESDGICEATDGCVVEPDGYCPHGKSSWLIKLGLL